MRRQGISHDDTLITRAVSAVPTHRDDGRLPSFIWARVSDIDDPLKQGRIKCKFYWQEEEGAAEMDTDWITRIVPYVGPTKMNRQRKFGFNWPFPEVGSMVALACMGGDVHDLVFLGQPEYLEGETGAPPTDKDDHIDWCFRITLPNGWEWGVDTEGNEYKQVPGQFRLKALGGVFLSARTIFTIFAPALRHVALAMNRFIGAKAETSNYLTPEEEKEVTDMQKDAMTAPPGYKDPGIGKVEDLE